MACDDFEAFHDMVDTEMLQALKRGDIQAIVLKLEAIGASNIFRLFTYVNSRFRTKLERTPLHILSEFSSDSHMAIADLLIENKADINAQDDYGDTPLHRAGANRNTRMLNLLCVRGGIRLNITNGQGLTALHVAITSSFAEGVSVLLRAGACTTIPIPSTSHADALATPSSLIIAKHLLAPLEWEGPKNVVDLEASFIKLFSDPALCATLRVFPFDESEFRLKQFDCGRMASLTGSLLHSSRSIKSPIEPDVNVCPLDDPLTLDLEQSNSTGAMFDLFSESAHLISTAKMEQMRRACYIAPEELYRSKDMKVAPKTLPPERQTPLSSPKSSLSSPNGKQTSSKSDSAAASLCVQAWEELLRQHRHRLADSASECSVCSDSAVLHYLDLVAASSPRITIQSSTLRNCSTAILLMPSLECLSICDVDVVGDTGDGHVIDWLPVFVQSLAGDTAQPQNVAKPGLLQELIIRNCKLTPTLYYPAMRLPLGIVNFDFSCNPELALSGVAYLLAAVQNQNAVRSLSFSRCTLESNVGVVADSHMRMIIAAFQKLTSLDHLDLSFNFFSIPQCSGIVNSLPTSITTLQLCGIQFLNDFNSFASVLRDCFCRLGPSLCYLSLSFNDTLVSFPPSVSLCEHLHYLDISYCNHLKFIPHEVFVAALSVLIACHNPSLESMCLLPGRSSNLKYVDLSCCSSLQTLPDEIYCPSLEVMLLSHNAALKNVATAGCGILNAVGLKFIDLTCCVQLSSLPDELADDRLAQLNSIIIDGCKNMVYPPYKAMHNKTQNIKDYLKAAKDQPPLKRVKVVLLGNGRCGKTSLLGSLAKRELDPNCPSTKCVQVDVFSKKLQTESWLKKSAKFVGADVSRFAPEMSYWDFPGQLEYSAAHDFFMSSRQAVYVIVFSVCDHPAAQQDQVRYWLNTILARYSNQIRVIIVGTKVDMLDSQLQSPGAGDLSMLRKAALEHCKLAIRQSVESIISYHNLTFTIPILFASSNKTHVLWKEQQKEIKAQISKLSEDIFRHCEGQLRFPKVHMKLFDEIQALSKCHPQKPVFSLNDEFITTRFKMLHALRGAPDGRSLQSLDVLSDVGLLVHYKCKGQDYVCPTPQYVANIISLLADADRICQPVISEQELRKILYANHDITRCIEGNVTLANQLIDFMMEIRLLTPAMSSHTGKETHFLIPLQLRGRPSFWQDCEIPIDTNATFKAVRHKASKGMVSVASFLRLMTEFCNDIVHMWGCAFISKLSESEYIFVRLSEDRSVVDVVTLVYAPQTSQSAAKMDEACSSIVSMLITPSEISAKVHLCPHCVASNHYMRSGVAHEFHKKQLDGRAETHLKCCRHHEESAANIVLGTRLQFKGSNKMPLLFPGSQADCICWIAVSEAGITNYCDASAADSDKHAGVVLPHSFFAISQQVVAGTKISRTDAEAILSAISSNAPSCTVALGGDDMQLLRLQYTVGDLLGTLRINRVINMMRAPLVVASSYASAVPDTVVVVTTSPHELSLLQPLVVDAACRSNDVAYGRDCTVREIIDDSTFVVEFLAQHFALSWEAPNYVRIMDPGTKIFRTCSGFCSTDNVVVVFEKDDDSPTRRPKFAMFPGRPKSNLEVAFLTQQSCGSGDLGLVWSEVEDHWAVMLGSEYPNYEMDSVTLFRNRDREDQFLQELNWLKTTGQTRPNPYKYPYDAFCCPSDDDTQRTSRSQMQRQVLGHFHDFQSKFCLLPSKENDGVNLSVVWWGHRPEAHHSCAQNGFQHLPPGLKVDPGYFGDGFYLTRYPRYSDYYISGCKLSTRDIKGCMLMSFAALGRPYPITQSPFEFKNGTVVRAKDSLLGLPCGDSCSCYSIPGGIPTHDSHFASVKFQSLGDKMKTFLPCPYRQEPEYDEIVVFKPERVMPAAHVTFKRRPRLLLWLDETPMSAENVRLKLQSIPGYAKSRSDRHEPAFDDSIGADAIDELASITDALIVAGISDSAASVATIPTLLHEFTTVASIAEFLGDHPECARYPSSLFRIITSCRLWLGGGGLEQFLERDPVWSSVYPSVLALQKLEKVPSPPLPVRPASSLPVPWEKQPTSSGSFYFLNTETGESRWDLSDDVIDNLIDDSRAAPASARPALIQTPPPACPPSPPRHLPARPGLIYTCSFDECAAFASFLETKSA